MVNQDLAQSGQKSRRISQLLIITILSLFILSSCDRTDEGKHLFILSGQSNMARLDPAESFTPMIESEYGKAKILVVKDAVGGQPIRRWYKKREAPGVGVVIDQPDLYDSLMVKVGYKIREEKIKSITFIWMQGERDAREELGTEYESSLIGLHRQLSADLQREDINFVIGRLSDFDMTNERYPHWVMVREIQMKVGNSNPRFGWVNTDDLNDGLDNKGNEIVNDLHMTPRGYKTLGQRFASASIELIEKN